LLLWSKLKPGYLGQSILFSFSANILMLSLSNNYSFLEVFAIGAWLEKSLELKEKR